MLYLFPTPLAEGRWQESIPEGAAPWIEHCELFIVEDLKTARRFLRAIFPQFNIDKTHFIELNQHTPFSQYNEMLGALQAVDGVLMSEAGLPGIADPGAGLIGLCHDWNIRVKPVSGPSSIVMALIASGLNGQHFTFHGYIPIDKKERIAFIKQMAKTTKDTRYTQIFIETPYRNDALFDDIIQHCLGDVKLCIARDITGAKEFIKTRPVREWKSQKPALHKIPTVFCLGN
jgi:16S rRNA (cytidine1402-2'-O)-methyltransferase